MKKEDIKDLLDRYKSGDCSPEECTLVENWYLTWDTGSFDLSEEEFLADLALVRKDLPGKRKHRLFSFKAVAAVAGLITLSLVYWFGYHQPVDKNKTTAVTAIVPGGNKATLTLSDGSTVALDARSSLQEINQSGVRISKPENGKLVYSNAKALAAVGAYNTLSTPKGGQYEVNLPDGTKVWLNAASTLRFPVAFAQNERRVELTGEAYFEVAKDSKKPFVVKSDQQQITVLGTHFNVNAYRDEDFTKTTLLEGSIRVNKGVAQTLLIPGQQAISGAASALITVRKNVDLSESIAWKNGLFLFEDEDIFSIMNKISRWYDIVVAYRGDLKGKKYSGNISKFRDVTEVLKTMQLTGTIQFKVEGRRIIVMP